MSINRRLLMILALSALVLLAAMFGDYRLALRRATTIYDQSLVEDALAVAAYVRVREGKPSLSLTPQEESVMRVDQEDKVYFAILDKSGRQVAGDTGLPTSAIGDNNLHFADASYRGQSVREVFYRISTDAGPATVVVAETQLKRQSMSQQIVAATLIPNVLLLFVMVAGVVASTRHTLAPLGHLTREIGSRSARDLRPLTTTPIPVEVQPLVAALNRLLGMLEESSAAQQRFLSNAAHQLRTPLAGLQTQLELARTDDEASRIERLRTMEQAADRLSHLVSQLLALARADPSANLSSQMQSIDIKSVVAASVTAHHQRAIAKNIDLGFELQSAPITGIVWLARELVNNLVDNAITYTPRGGVVTVRCGVRGSLAFLEVEDDGPGIPPSERRKVFDRFYRIAETGDDGCGLGLAIVREIAQVHRAGVDIDAPPGGRGTLVTVTIPSPAAD